MAIGRSKVQQQALLINVTMVTSAPTLMALLDLGKLAVNSVSGPLLVPLVTLPSVTRVGIVARGARMSAQRASSV